MIKITRTNGMELHIRFSTIKEAQFIYGKIVPLIMDYNKDTREKVLKGVK